MPVLNYTFGLSQRHFPTQWKQSAIVPVYKKDTACIENCRPILLLDNSSEVFEFLIHDHLSYCFRRKLSSSQHRFFQSKPTITMVSYLDFISPLVCSQQQVDTCYFDLSSTFDVHYTLLLHKVSACRLTNAYVIWLDSYLTGHYFVV